MLSAEDSLIRRIDREFDFDCPSGVALTLCTCAVIWSGLSRLLIVMVAWGLNIIWVPGFHPVVYAVDVVARQVRCCYLWR